MTPTAGERWCFRAVRPFHAALDEAYTRRETRRFAITYSLLLVALAVAAAFIPGTSTATAALVWIGCAAAMLYFVVVSNVRELKRCGLCVADEALAVRSLDRFDWLPLPVDSVLVVEAPGPAAKHWKVYTEHDAKRSLRVRRREYPNLIEQLRGNCLQSWRKEQPIVDAADDSPIRDRLRINRTEDDSG